MSRVIAFVCAALCLASGAASAAGPEDLGLGYLTAVKEGVQPSLVLKPTVAVKSVVFTLTARGSRVQQVVKVGAVAANATKKVPIVHGEGRETYDGSIAVEWGDGSSGDFTFTFDAVRYHALTIDMTWEDVDLAHREVTCRASHEVSRIVISLLDAGGAVIAREQRDFDPPIAGGEELSIAWGESERAAAKLKLEVFDPDGVWASMAITPFTITIPHDEVQFELGRADLPKGEVPKLERTLAALRKALAEHGTLLDLKLFVAGFTDTVGDRATNQALSLKRAAAISGWFRAKGVRLPIFYRGFGEEELAVATPDETDEVRNRRALYILSVHPPLGVRVAASGWEALTP